MDKYRINLINNLRALQPLIIMAITFVIAIIFFSQQSEYFDYLTILIILIFISPAWGSIVVVHLDYLRVNWNAELIINYENQFLIYKDRRGEKKINFEQITQIVKNQTKKNALMGDSYDYFEIHTKNGEVIIVTSLMTRKLEIPDVELKILDRYIPSIYFSERSYNNEVE
jgi:hypothetical protein